MSRDLFGSLNISVSAMRAERKRMDVVMSNLANVASTRTPQGGPYKRREVIFQSMLDRAAEENNLGAGVEVSEVVLDEREPIRVLRPGHPDADKDGYVSYPNIQTADEMVDLMTSARAYEANTVAFRMAREMFVKALELGRG